MSSWHVGAGVIRPGQKRWGYLSVVVEHPHLCFFRGVFFLTTKDKVFKMTNTNNYISARDIAENAKLNYEIAEELRKYKINHQLSCQCPTLGRSAKQLTLRCERRRMAEAQCNRRCIARGDTMRVFVVSQATLERYNKFTRNCSCCCETAEAVETTAKSELFRLNKDSLATWMLVSSTSMTEKRDARVAPWGCTTCCTGIQRSKINHLLFRSSLPLIVSQRTTQFSFPDIANHKKIPLQLDCKGILLLET